MVCSLSSWKAKFKSIIFWKLITFFPQVAVWKLVLSTWGNVSRSYEEILRKGNLHSPVNVVSIGTCCSPLYLYFLTKYKEHVYRWIQHFLIVLIKSLISWTWITALVKENWCKPSVLTSGKMVYRAALFAACNGRKLSLITAKPWSTNLSLAGSFQEWLQWMLKLEASSGKMLCHVR